MFDAFLLLFDRVAKGVLGEELGLVIFDILNENDEDYARLLNGDDEPQSIEAILGNPRNKHHYNQKVQNLFNNERLKQGDNQNYHAQSTYTQ